MRLVALYTRPLFSLLSLQAAAVVMTRCANSQ